MNRSVGLELLGLVVELDDVCDVRVLIPFEGYEKDKLANVPLECCASRFPIPVGSRFSPRFLSSPQNRQQFTPFHPHILSPTIATPHNPVQTTEHKEDLLFNLANLLSLSLFFGNIPLTARLRISPPPFFSINFSMVQTLRLPGLVLCL